MATVKRVRLMDKVLQTVHNNGTIVSENAHIKQVASVKGTIIGSLYHEGSKLKVTQQVMGVWRVI